MSATDKKVVPILMPQAGQTMEEGTILSWKVRQGDRIEVGQVILEIETDKATMEVEAADAGRVAKIVAKEGQVVAVKTPIAYIADEGVDVDAYLSPQSPVSAPQTNSQIGESVNETSQVLHTRKTNDGARIKISPAARKLAEQKGVDISTISVGSGPDGRIVAKDIENAATHTPTPTPTPTPAPAPVVAAAAPKMSRMRRIIAERLTFSKQNIPHFYVKLTIDAQKLFDLYKRTKQQTQCSVNDFVVMACAKAISWHAAFRSQYKNDQIVESANVNIGIAVGLDDGLVVPVVVCADKMDFKTLAARSRAIIETARNGKIEGMGQGIFTITNLGMFGIEEFSAIINPPESAILAVGAIREDIKVENGAIKPTRLMTLTLSVDHRVIDGVAAAKFLQTLKELLEKPEQLVN